VALKSTLPILYSFRRCPYAIRARLALCLTKTTFILREVSLKNKPQELTSCSPNATVPCCLLPQDKVLTESLDIVDWATQCHSSWQETSDQQVVYQTMLQALHQSMIPALMTYKYSADLAERQQSYVMIQQFLVSLENSIQGLFLQGPNPLRLDVVIFPLVRQLVRINETDFFALPFPRVIDWYRTMTQLKVYDLVMQKHPVWQAGQTDVIVAPAAA
jgi:glutathione S-transferase